MTLHIPRRAALLLPLAFARPTHAAEPVRIGYQKLGALVIVRRQALFEALFAPQPVQWVEFGSGPPMLEALNAGAIDFGATGDTPPIFAQAAGTDLVYVGAQPLVGDNQAILVRDDGPIRSLLDLKGRRVAFTRGSSAHNVVLRALERAGLTPGDIQPVPLAPPDAASAFRTGAVDAWAIWDPFLAIAQQDPAARVLVQGTDVAPSNTFFLARRAWATRYPEQVVAMLRAINRAAEWAAVNPEPLAVLMSEVTGVPIAAQRVAAVRGVYAVQVMDDAIAAQQQAIADLFAKFRVLPKSVDIRTVVWVPPGGGL